MSAAATSEHLTVEVALPDEPCMLCGRPPREHEPEVELAGDGSGLVQLRCKPTYYWPAEDSAA